MDVIVNGARRSAAPGSVVADVVPAVVGGIAVALNDAVVPRAEHATTRLADGDRIEIVTAVQGG